MKHFKTKKIPATKIKFIDFVTCDFCGKKKETKCFELK